MKRLLFQRQFVLAALVAAGAVAVGVVFAARNLASSQEGSGVVDHSKITPVGIGVEIPGTPNYPPDPGTLPTCQAPADERPNPDVPPLSCRNTAGEPPPGAISTPAPAEEPDVTAIASRVPEGWTVLNNALFRYTLALPPGWYADMRPEGGTFVAYDRVASEEAVGKTNPPGGVLLSFSARQEVVVKDPAGVIPIVERHLLEPNAMFGDLPGALWIDDSGEGLAMVLRGAFAKDGIVFEFRAHIEDDGRLASNIDADRALVEAVLGTITAY